ncbi:flavin reductase family protein [Acidisoma cellulosilytica]|uniref:Flavin reductase family protein n=1 Tax=Acidisoma cellulosilyticum TaxID=2802395 RepID=A0A963YZG9_9PROT|nr:flavin reductase family protein [Acidisoma cellulosilyticum]MCB8879910.1 flavin reductase family protein [Acidisoma cellulosilyticum]
MTETHFYQPEQGHRLPHDPLKAIIAPRPIGWISTVSTSGHVNLAPYSFFNMVSDIPPMVMFSSNGWKDSVRNAEETGEFVANLAVEALAKQMNESCVAVPHDVDEFELAGLAKAPSVLVAPPRVAIAPAALECKCVSIQQLQGLGGVPSSNYMVIGQIVGVHIDPAFLKDGKFDTAGAMPLGRCGYRGDYVSVSSLFEMVRPR